MTAFYTTFGSIVNDTSMAGIFRTVLTDVNDGDKLTSTATIDRVSLEDDGRNISCGGISALSWQQLHVEGILLKASGQKGLQSVIWAKTS